jgi:lysozyme
MDIDAKSLIAKNEGLKLKPYLCPAGKLTIGYGHNLDDNGITEEQADMLLDYDIGKAYNDLNRIFGEFADSIDNISDNRYAALLDMMFNLGMPKFLKFEKMITAIKQGDWPKAADELKDSAYYKQVGNRAKVNENILRYDADETQ